MRSGREDGCGQVYDQDANVLLFQDEYVVAKDEGFIGSNCPSAPFPITETQLFLTNWRLVALSDPQTVVNVQRVAEGTHAHLTVLPGSSECACDYLEVYLDEVREFKKSLLGEIKLRMQVGTVELTGLSKPFRAELAKALDWYLTSHK
jgi:hypothetical protein